MSAHPVLPRDLLVERQRRFPIGTGIDLDELARDPYPVYARLQAEEPISWIAPLQMWYVTRHADVRALLLDTRRFTTRFERSTIYETFGAQILTSEGDEHDRYRSPIQPDFSPQRVRARMEAGIRERVDALIDTFERDGTTEVRASFATRLPIQAMLLLCDLPPAVEPRFRHWYDRFEAALANFTGDVPTREAAKVATAELHDFLAEAQASRASLDPWSLLAAMASTGSSAALTAEEIRRNVSIILFGGISTVEALILNLLWALLTHDDVLARVTSDRTQLGPLIEETLRWRSPVQSATRHALVDVDWGDADIRAGEVINGMLGAANRDSGVFVEPDRFILRRNNARQHLAFATGVHSCLGMHLAKLEAQIAIDRLLTRLPGIRLCVAESATPSGYEFHQSRRLQVDWRR